VPLLARPLLALAVDAVYAVGLYVDGHGAKKALSKYKGHSVDFVIANQQLFDGESVGERVSEPG
jgi:hypothetical protein